MLTTYVKYKACIYINGVMKIAAILTQLHAPIESSKLIYFSVIDNNNNLPLALIFR